MYRIFFLPFVLALSACGPQNLLDMPEPFDWQGHRGARGLAPENSLPGFEEALKYPVTTLELDLAVSKDRQLVVSHEPWFSATICQGPDGAPIPEEEEKRFRIWEMTYREIAAYDCGSKGHPGFPRQQTSPVRKPLLGEVIATADEYCRENDLPLVRFNIEIKSRPEWDGIFTPPVDTFAALVLAEVERLNVEGRTCIQAFDERPLRIIRQARPEQQLAYLVEDPASLDTHLERLGFIPDIFSPHYALLTRSSIYEAHQKGMQVIPWTVNELDSMRALIRMGVDGIITDYPDLIPEVEAGP